MIQLKNIYKAFDSLEVVKDFTLDIVDGEVICLLGPSGCGKSTLLKMISGLDQNFEGSILGLEDKSISYVFQESRLLPWLSVKENLTYILEGKIETDKLESHIDYFLDKVELSAFKDAFPNTLSGGMKQRVSLARAFSMPHEPFQGLDDKLKDQLMNLLENLIELDKKTVVMVTHDLSEAFRLGHKVIRLVGKPITHSEEVKES
jgi:NitT/TauT family transport system ATP-binding protein